ncbi:MAG: protein-(glutamine-N5) methyltransferase, release factor-specific [Aequorivita sp.]|nr:protein-(glutamine-N5) methyltransferase, release factor-specific [Aequorivita sp.]|tara:strand:+ start:24042 stop:24899 length:858 start_codon:yes stop_codon:yes gene_type:complete
MNILELKKQFQESLSEKYPLEEIQSFFNILSESYLNLSRIQIATNPEIEVSKSDLEKFQNALLRLRRYEPIQYIIGETEFYGLPIKVNNYTLIPRPETEELVSWVLDEISESSDAAENKTILDVGTGSGCIAISVAKHIKNANVSAIDISEEALKIARYNAEINAANVSFLKTDVLKANSLKQNFDIIISNPPYVRELEKEQMQENVLKFEPDTALYVKNEDPLLFYRVISILAKKHLKPGGKLFFEINEYLSEELAALLKSKGFKDIEVKQDIFGKDRMVKCNL